MKARRQLVSVILPTFNRERFIGQAITSVLNQTYEDIELIVIDDGSIDGTSDVVASFPDPRLRYVRLATNVGRSAARNKGLRSARGEFIAFLDSDDYYLPTKIGLQVDFLNNNPQFSMVYTSAGCFQNEGSPINYFYRAQLSGDIYKDIAFFKPLTITLPTVMLRKEVVDEIGDFDEAMSRFEDTDYWRRVSRRFRIGAIDEVTCHIRSHDGNLITAFHPSSFESAIDYYVRKIEAEDPDLDTLIMGAGTRRLYELYGKALPREGDGGQLSERLMAKGRDRFQPLVSIIVPVYNGANYLRQAVDSALAQTYLNVEVVIVNDGSTDGGATEEIIRSYGERVRGFTQPNGGCAAALNKAVAEARGVYISWLSHDDLMAPTKIEKQVELLSHQSDPTATIIYGNYSVFFGDEPVFSDVPAVDFPQVQPEYFRYFLTTQNCLHGCTLLIPRHTILQHGMFVENLRTVLDFDLWFKLAKTNRFVFCAEVGIHSRAHPDQDSNRKRDLFMTEANDMLARFTRELSPVEIRAASNVSLTKGYYVIAESFHRRGFESAAERTLALIEANARELLTPGSENPEASEVLESLLSLSRASVAGGVPSRLAGPMAYAPIQYEGQPECAVAAVAVADAPPEPTMATGGALEAPAASPRSYRARLAVLLVAGVKGLPLVNQLGLKVFHRLPTRLRHRLAAAWRSR